MNIDEYRICWYMTEKCHLECPFCYAFKGGIHPSYKEMYGVGSALVSQGINSVNLAGGEPLLNKSTFKVIEKFYDEIDLSLTTSAALQDISLLLENSQKLSRVCVSLDSISKPDAILLRGNRYNVDVVLWNISLIANSRRDIEINTVLTKHNRYSLNKMADYLANLNCIVTWKIFQVTYNENNKNLDSSWYLSHIEFEKQISSIQSKYGNLNIIPYSSSRLNTKYLIIRPTGDICFPLANNYDSLGNIKNIDVRHALSPWLLGRTA